VDFEFDLAFCNPENLSPDRFETLEYHVDRLVALLPADHPLCVMKTIDLKLLAGEKLLLMDNSTPIYDICYDLFAKAGFEPQVHFFGVRIENFIEMVSNKMGIAVLLKKHITGVNKHYAVIREIYPTATRAISFVRVKNRRHSAVSKKFWNYLQELTGIT
jgi:DNA-binding transcriptional LysR family regulator